MVNPKQFYYADGSFTDPGIIQPPDPTYHRVATGVMFQFGIDYSRGSCRYQSVSTQGQIGIKVAKRAALGTRGPSDDLRDAL